MLYRFQHKYAPYLFVAPFLVLFGVFGLYPLVQSLILSFFITAGPTQRVFVGLDNFAFLLGDNDFRKALWNTIVFASASVLVQLPLSLGLAMLLNRRYLKGRGLFRLGFFSPHLVGMVFVGVMFTVILAPNFGLLNVMLHSVTSWLEPIFGPGVVVSLDTRWLTKSSLVMPALVLTSLWLYVGFNMVYFLAALQAVDQDLYDAAKVDGAGPWSQFWHVTVPGIRHVAVFVIVLSTIGSFQLFELPYLLLNSGPGPDNAGLTIVMYLYQTGFVTGDLGYASAIGWVLVLLIMAISLTQLWLSGTWKKE